MEGSGKSTSLRSLCPQIETASQYDLFPQSGLYHWTDGKLSLAGVLFLCNNFSDSHFLPISFVDTLRDSSSSPSYFLAFLTDRNPIYYPLQNHHCSGPVRVSHSSRPSSTSPARIGSNRPLHRATRELSRRHRSEDQRPGIRQ